MKTILLIVISFFLIEISFAQTGADYYLPLCTGNFLKLYTGGTPGGSGWEARHTFYGIFRSDVINGKLYFLEKGIEITDKNPTDTSVFQCFWLRKDSIGNILIGASDATGTGNLDSATIANPPGLYFPNQFLTVGYAQSYSMGNGMTGTDSVISVSATAGTYINCIQIRFIRKVNGTVDIIEDTYYAYHLGQVKDERLYPNNQIHTDDLVGYLATNCYSAIIEQGFGNENELNIYPDPSNGKFTITFPSLTREIQILNSVGQVLQTKFVYHEKRMDFNLTSDGIYLIRIKTDQQTLTRKLIICNMTK